jgi:hypothetical protein
MNKWTKWTKRTRTVVPMMGQKCTRKRPAYDAGKIGEEQKRRINATMTGIQLRGKKQSKTPN